MHETFSLPDHEQLKMLTIGATITSTGCIALMIGLALLPNPLIVSVCETAHHAIPLNPLDHRFGA